MAAIQIGDLIPGEPLGQGGYGFVMEGTHRDTGQRYALKQIRYTPEEEIYVQREIDNLMRMHHRYITAYYTHDVVELSPTFHEAHIVTELCSGGTLESKVVKTKTRLATSRLVTWIHQLAEAICAMHELNIMHRDIKSSNVLLTSTDFGQAEVRLCDLGLSRRCVELSQSQRKNDAYMTPHVGTVANWAPELFTSTYGLGVDVWSLGCLAYELVMFTPAFKSRDKPEFRLKHNEIKENGFKFPSNSVIHPLVQDFIAKCFTYDQYERPTIQRLLQHAMFQEASLDDQPESPIPIAAPIVSQQLPDINTLMTKSVALAQENLRLIREFELVFGPDVAKRMVSAYRADLQGQINVLRDMQARFGPVVEQWISQLKAASQELASFISR